MDYDIMKSAFDDELQKIAVSSKWIADKVRKAKVSPEKLKQFASKMADKGKALRNKGDTIHNMIPEGSTKGMSASELERRRQNIKDGYRMKDQGDKRLAAASAAGEKTKKAGALQGHVRSGRRPLKADTLLKKEKSETKDNKKKIADLTKLSGSLSTAERLGLLGIGAYGLHRLNKMNRRYQMGRQMEMQQQGYGF